MEQKNLKKESLIALSSNMSSSASPKVGVTDTSSAASISIPSGSRPGTILASWHNVSTSSTRRDRNSAGMMSQHSFNASYLII
jgi:hypothetical protein